MNIVEIYEDEVRVSHRVIAEQTGNQIKSIQNLITSNIEDLEEFGKVIFELTPIKTIKSGTQNMKTYYLNEQQATLLTTYMRNSEIVRKFKITLVKEFYKMRQQLEQLKENNKSTNLKIKKLDSTNDIVFKTLTVLIKDYNLENEFTAIALNNLLVKIGLAEKIQITTYYIKFKKYFSNYIYKL